jgi:hypothetical protein
MRNKMIVLILAMVIAMVPFSGCGQVTPTTTIDTTASASVVSNAADFEKAISKDGSWIIATTKDLTINKELVLEGDFKNGKKDNAGNELLQRKIGLYTQDSKGTVTARFSLTVIKLTIKSANPSIEHGTFNGDLYVAVKNFKLIDMTVNGNIYFQSEDIKASFIVDAASKISGVQEVKAF